MVTNYPPAPFASQLHYNRRLNAKILPNVQPRSSEVEEEVVYLVVVVIVLYATVALMYLPDCCYRIEWA